MVEKSAIFSSYIRFTTSGVIQGLGLFFRRATLTGAFLLHILANSFIHIIPGNVVFTERTTKYIATIQIINKICRVGFYVPELHGITSNTFLVIMIDIKFGINEIIIDKIVLDSLHWRHNDHDGVSNHQPYGCLLNRLFRRKWTKTSKLRVTGLCVGNSPGPVNSPHKGPVPRKMIPFDDVTMTPLFLWRPGWDIRIVSNVVLVSLVSLIGCTINSVSSYTISII